MTRKGIKKAVATLAITAVVGVSGLLGTQIATLPTDNGVTVSTIPVGIQTKTEPYVVQRVVDGDTLEIIFEGKAEKVRLIGVDTPETVKAGTPVQWYGREASDFAKKTLAGKKVTLEFDKGQRDLYGRLLAYVYEENGDMFNIVLLHRGYAKTEFYSPNTRHKSLFIDVEATAKKIQLGRWDAESESVWNSVYTKK